METNSICNILLLINKTKNIYKVILLFLYMITLVEYVWIGGNNELRSKTKVLDKEINVVNDLPVWNFDGSSTQQADGKDSEVIIKPRALFNDPFRMRNHKLVLCDTYTPDDKPLFNNHTRVWANNLFNQKLDEEPWYGLEQEYFFLIDPKTDFIRI